MSIQETFATVMEWFTSVCLWMETPANSWVGVPMGLTLAAITAWVSFLASTDWHKKRGHRWFWPADRLLALVAWPVRRVVAWRRREKPTPECPHCGAQSEAGKVEPFGFVCRVWHKRLAADLFRCRHCGKESGSAAAKDPTPQPGYIIGVDTGAGTDYSLHIPGKLTVDGTLDPTPGTVDAGRVRAWEGTNGMIVMTLLQVGDNHYSHSRADGSWVRCESTRLAGWTEMVTRIKQEYRELPPNEAEQLNAQRLAGDKPADDPYEPVGTMPVVGDRVCWINSRHGAGLPGGPWEVERVNIDGNTVQGKDWAYALSNFSIAHDCNFAARILKRQPPTRRDAGESETRMTLREEGARLIGRATLREEGARLIGAKEVPYGSAPDPLAAPVTQAQLAESLAAVNRRIDENEIARLVEIERKRQIERMEAQVRFMRQAFGGQFMPRYYR